ncbi:Hpt domain-containing protein [Scytonema sp. NUACC26]|uniref:Hpt domain-containing protein n=1 Tax=Scytonema sp. NUACC26 TaxID=3140176 RepID=UPI0034DBBD3F
MNEYSIIDLFRQEIQTQVTIFRETLGVLRTQPFSMTELERATQAAHSVWGTARLVDLEVASNLAEALKQCFLAAQNKTVTLGEEQIELLLHASDLLLSMSKAVDRDFEQWLSDYSWDLATTQKAISILLSGNVVTGEMPVAQLDNISSMNAVTGETPVPQLLVAQSDAIHSVNELTGETPVPQLPVAQLDEIHSVNVLTGETPVPQLLVAQLDEIHSVNVLTGETPVPQLPIAQSDAIHSVNALSRDDDGSMMDLFRLEAEAQIAVMNDGLLALESNPRSAQALETLMRAAHSIKGSA